MASDEISNVWKSIKSIFYFYIKNEPIFKPIYCWKLEAGHRAGLQSSSVHTGSVCFIPAVTEGFPG